MSGKDSQRRHCLNVILSRPGTKRGGNIGWTKGTMLTRHAYFMTVFNLRYLVGMKGRFPVGLELKIKSCNVRSLHNLQFISICKIFQI